MQALTINLLASLVRTGSVRHVFLKKYPEIDGGGWYLEFDHSDYHLTRQLYTQRGGVRMFKTAEAAIKTLDASGYIGNLVIVGKTADH